MRAVAAKKDISFLKRRLDALYEGYDFEERAMHDPIRVPRRYRDKEDAEAAAFVSSAFAFGSARAFLPVIERLMALMGPSPSGFLSGFDAGKNGRAFEKIGYRFYTPSDVAAILHATGELIRRHGGLEAAFMGRLDPRDADVGGALSGLSSELMGVDVSPAYRRGERPRGYKFFFPSPRNGSPCKRANLFLRWMARGRDIDLGLWKGLPASKLVIPLDVHIARVARCLGLTGRKSNDWKTALEVTESLRAIDPEDPLRYDFALCHMGMSGLCSEENCGRCPLPAAGGGPRGAS